MKIKKYMTLVSAIITMVCLGGVYAWSVFVPGLISDYGLTASQTQFTFGLLIAVFTLAMIAGGKLEKIIGPRMLSLLSGVFFLIGYVTAFLSKGNPAVIILGIGVFAGIGTGFGYLIAITTPIKWFPDKKGMITGLSVAGFGGGAMLLSFIAETMIGNNVDILKIFMIIGLSYGVLILLSSFLIFTPDADSKKESSKINVPLKEVIRSRANWGLFIGMFAGTFAGLLITGNLKPIGLSYGLSSATASLGISFLAIGNSLGRVVWGTISDFIGTRLSIISALFMLSLVIFLVPLLAAGKIMFLILALLIGFGFGANFVLFAARISGVYGVEKLGSVYPYIFLSYGIAGITGPAFAGWQYDISASYTLSIIIAGLICISGMIAYAALGRKIVNSEQ